MATETIAIDDIVKESGEYLSHNPDLISAAINNAEITLDQHTRPITKVKGKYPQGHTLLDNVIQGFKPEWNELGKLRIQSKLLKDYHQKVNFSIVPAEILASYWAALYQENLKPEDMPISKYIIENELIPQTIDDLDWLSVNGEYNAAKLEEFGFSMDGIVKVLSDMKSADVIADTVASPFKIPVDALTDTNIVDQVTAFERALPSKMKRKVKKIFMSENNVERYILDYEDKFGQNQFQTDQLKTRLGKREIVAIPGMETDDIFATTDQNFVRLIDIFDMPEITDVQKQDYKVKYFMEFWKGYDFLIDELVFVANYEDNIYGLGTESKNKLYYDFDGVNVA